MTLRALNWGHRRATAPMHAAAQAARERYGIAVQWDVQTLAGFEHGLDAALAERYDLIVFDHPFCGAVAAQRLMRALDDVVALDDEDFAGRSLDSYRYAGRLWALPVDAATQSAILRPDLMVDRALPSRWSDVIALGNALRRSGSSIGIATATPHGVLVLLALCANLGHPLSHDPWSTPFDRATLSEAAELLRETVSLAHPAGRRMNAIQLHDAMSATDDIAYCPLAYVYATYAEADQRRPLRFAPFPGADGTCQGSVLGGTGLGITRSCRELDAAIAFVRMLATEDAQRALIMRHHGQPARAEAWRGAPEDAAFGGVHAQLREAIERAWTRPRFPGYIGWQADAGAAVEAFLGGEYGSGALAERLETLWRRHAPDVSRIAG